MRKAAHAHTSEFGLAATPVKREIDHLAQSSDHESDHRKSLNDGDEWIRQTDGELAHVSPSGSQASAKRSATSPSTTRGVSEASDGFGSNNAGEAAKSGGSAGKQQKYYVKQWSTKFTYPSDASSPESNASTKSFGAKISAGSSSRHQPQDSLAGGLAALERYLANALERFSGPVPIPADGASAQGNEEGSIDKKSGDYYRQRHADNSLPEEEEGTRTRASRSADWANNSANTVKVAPSSAKKPARQVNFGDDGAQASERSGADDYVQATPSRGNDSGFAPREDGETAEMAVSPKAAALRRTPANHDVNAQSPAGVSASGKKRRSVRIDLSNLQQHGGPKHESSKSSPNKAAQAAEVTNSISNQHDQVPGDKSVGATSTPNRIMPKAIKSITFDDGAANTHQDSRGDDKRGPHAMLTAPYVVHALTPNTHARTYTDTTEEHARSSNNSHASQDPPQHEAPHRSFGLTSTPAKSLRTALGVAGGGTYDARTRGGDSQGQGRGSRESELRSQKLYDAELRDKDSRHLKWLEARLRELEDDRCECACWLDSLFCVCRILQLLGCPGEACREARSLELIHVFLSMCVAYIFRIVCVVFVLFSTKTCTHVHVNQ